MCMGFCDISVPSSINSPVAPFTCPVIALNKVVFPAPLEPIRPVTPPAGISKKLHQRLLRHRRQLLRHGQ